MNEPPPKQRFPSWKQALVIFCGGIVLALSSCAAFLANLNAGGNLPAVFAGGFITGAIASLVGFVLILIRAIRGPGVARVAAGKPEEKL
jgi:hypothetical protein